jgi:hypothetical protein
MKNVWKFIKMNDDIDHKYLDNNTVSIVAKLRYNISAIKHVYS